MTIQRLSSARSRSTVLLALAATLLLAACRTSDVYAPPGGVSAAMPTMASVSPIVGEAEFRAPATYVVDATNGHVLYQENPDALRFPASLTKLMTLYLVFEAIDTGRLSISGSFAVSAEAASRPPAKIGLEAGSTIPVRSAIQAIAIRSANDVAAVIAENLAGSEENFARVMTARARSLGMRNTQFVNASGLPDVRQVSTARDTAVLAQAIRTRFPNYLAVFRAKEFDYDGRTFLATNKLIGKVPGVDGMKTGYIRDAGFHLVATAQRGNRSIIVVVMGGKTGAERDARVTALIEEYL
ncbi:D-alanyl-D-alanine carboxypeptidase family protein [Aureimonas mangrovi]|uniref:D-alanyl-D-alanine carboxypeptidase family protein n=1 Tax=Aureimonas mangrovi TaxID=2758041 RepID=UPI00163DE4A1|nr:D-alanyl-D-alanine carboxypeptidase family protein [Aureimonas mangrovi]